MDPVTLALIMAAAGAAKSELVDRPEAEKKSKLEYIKGMYSPWTGQMGDQSKVVWPNTAGSAINMGMSGYMLGQNMQDSKIKNAYLKNKMNRSRYSDMVSNDPRIAQDPEIARDIMKEIEMGRYDN